MDVSVHGFWKRGTSALFDTQIVNLDTGSYLRQTSSKDLETTKKEKKDKYLQPCLVHWHSFTPMIFSMDEITRTEDVAAQKRLDLLLSNKLK